MFHDGEEGEDHERTEEVSDEVSDEEVGEAEEEEALVCVYSGRKAVSEADFVESIPTPICPQVLLSPEQHLYSCTVT